MSSSSETLCSWVYDDFTYCSVVEVTCACSIIQHAAIDDGVIQIGQTSPPHPRDVPRFGSKDGMKVHFRRVVTKFSEFADQFPATKCSSLFRQCLEKLAFIADGLHHLFEVMPSSFVQTQVLSDREALKVIELAVDVHPKPSLRYMISESYGSFTEDSVIKLFQDISAIATDYEYELQSERVEYSRILFEWNFPVNDKYLWYPFEPFLCC